MNKLNKLSCGLAIGLMTSLALAENCPPPPAVANGSFSAPGGWTIDTTTKRVTPSNFYAAMFKASGKIVCMYGDYSSNAESKTLRIAISKPISKDTKLVQYTWVDSFGGDPHDKHCAYAEGNAKACSWP